jgi:hypothetical protein
MTVGGEGAGRRVASGVARVASGAGTAVRRTVPVACTGSRVRVEVSVAAPARAISFQAACSSSPATEVGG